MSEKKRASRSCANCRRIKSKCVGGDTPPCHRCRESGAACTFSAPVRQSLDDKASSRMTQLESQISHIYNTLESVLEAVSPASTSNPTIPAKRSLEDDNIVDSSVSSFPPYTVRTPDNRKYTAPVIRDRDRDPDRDPGPAHDGTRTAPSESLNILADASSFSNKISGNAASAERYTSRTSNVAPFDVAEAAASSPAHHQHRRPDSLAEHKAHSKSPANDNSQRSLFERIVPPSLMSENDARLLHKFFMDKCLYFVRILDFKTDTFDSLMERSPFCLKAVLAVASRMNSSGVRSSPEGVDWLTNTTQEKMKSFIFASKISKEDVQGVGIIASWTSPTYVPTSLAMHMALEMRLNDAFWDIPRPHDQSAQLSLATRCRTYLVLYLQSIQVSLGTGRPMHMRDHAMISSEQWHAFLKHPCANPYDIKLVGDLVQSYIKIRFVETLVSLRGDTVIGYVKHTVAALDEWFKEWDSRLAGHFSPESIERQSHLHALHYCRIFLFCSAIEPIERSHRTQGESIHGGEAATEAKELTQMAQESALACLDICLRRQAFKESLAYATPSQYLEICFGALLLIKTANTLPEDQWSGMIQDVQDLVSILSVSESARRYSTTIKVALNQLLSKINDNGIATAGSSSPHNQSLQNNQYTFENVKNFRPPSSNRQPMFRGTDFLNRDRGSVGLRTGISSSPNNSNTQNSFNLMDSLAPWLQESGAEHTNANFSSTDFDSLFLPPEWVLEPSH